MSLQTEMKKLARQAKAAAQELANLPADAKNKALRRGAQALIENAAVLIRENAKDLAVAEKSKLSAALVDRLKLDTRRIEAMAKGLREVAELPDPVGKLLETRTRPNGIEISKVRVPLGVIFIIYESRPNVTADSAGLCLKSGNAVILRGGKEALHSNKAIAKILRSAFSAEGIPGNAVQIISTIDYQAVKELLKCEEEINLVIPRGGENLIRTVVEHSRVPVIKHYKGVCHTYVDKDADLDMAEKIVINAKVQRPATCNAMESLLIHQSLARSFLPRIVKALKEKNVELRGSKEVKKMVPNVKLATEKDWGTEYLDLILSVKLVKDEKEAIEHIRRYGSSHSDSIVTKNPQAAEKFLNEVDSSAVFLNASTRLNDGGEFGLGAEIGISTDKIHARGPMGLEELTSYKYVVRGSGQIRT